MLLHHLIGWLILEDIFPKKIGALYADLGLIIMITHLNVQLELLKKTIDKSEPHLGTLPFLAPTAAVLILSELIKKRESYQNYPLSPENFIQFSMNFDEMNEFILIKKNKLESCQVCRSQSLAEYPDSFKQKFIKMI